MNNNIKTLPAFFMCFPITAIVLQISAIVIGISLMSDPDAASALFTWLCIANGFTIVAMVFALVGSIKRTKSMYIVGSGISLAVSYFANITIFAMAVFFALEGNTGYTLLIAGVVVSFIFTIVASVLLFIASLVTGPRKKSSYSFLATAAIITLVIYSIFTFSVVSLIVKVNFVTVQAVGYVLCSNLSLILLMLSLIIFSFMKHPENDLVEPQAGPTIIIANAQVEEATKKYLGDAAKKATQEPKKEIEEPKDDPAEQLRKYKQMLDEGLITEEDYNNKKKEILK